MSDSSLFGEPSDRWILSGSGQLGSLGGRGGGLLSSLRLGFPLPLLPHCLSDAWVGSCMEMSNPFQLEFVFLWETCRWAC